MSEPTRHDVADFARFQEWCHEPHEILRMGFDRITLFSVLASLQAARECLRIPESLVPQVDLAIFRLRELLPDDIRAASHLGDHSPF